MLKPLKKIASTFHKRIAMILFYGQRLTFSETNTTKTIIICFDGVFSHGGLVDRIKGMISFYEVAQQLDCNFKIRFDHPFDLSVYFEPNTYNWKLEKKVCYNPFDTQVVYLMDNFECNPLTLIQQSKAKTILVYCNIDYSKTMFPEYSVEELATQWRSNFNELFKKSVFLSQEIAKLPQEEHLVFHTRFTSLMGDFKDSSVTLISAEEKQQLLLTLVDKIHQKAALFPNRSVYVLSDSVVFLDYIRQNTSYKVLAGTPKHVDIKNNDASFASHTKTLTDFFFIASSDSVYLLKEKKMYMSGFSKYAAILGDKPFEVIQ